MTETPPPYGPPAGYGTPGGGWGAPPAPRSPGAPAPWAGEQETEPKAIVALVLAVLTWTPVVPFVGAVAALVLAHYAKRDIARSAGRKTGTGMVRAAVVLSVVHLVFVALLFALVLVLLVLGVGLPFLGD